MEHPRRIPRVLSIAGSDSGGGAGIQADLKAFAACGVHGMTAITAITAQNTVGVSAVHNIPPEMIVAQIRAVSQDIGVDAVKIGMLGNAATIAAVAHGLDELPRGTPVVLDPVMVAESGAELLDPTARDALIALLLPRTTVVTPNLPEALALVDVAPVLQEGRALVADALNVEEGRAVAGGLPNLEDGHAMAAPSDAEAVVAEPDVAALARAIHAFGPSVVIITGGHRTQATDVFFDGEAMIDLTGDRHPDGAAHGSGCTHASVLAACLAWGDEPLVAARTAKVLAARAVRDGLSEIGAGPGPVDVLGVPSRDRTR
jgi:hydroxymethylpyrimidine/phosphomethylpyrimidine kinase